MLEQRTPAERLLVRAYAIYVEGFWFINAETDRFFDAGMPVVKKRMPTATSTWWGTAEEWEELGHQKRIGYRGLHSDEDQTIWHELVLLDEGKRVLRRAVLEENRRFFGPDFDARLFESVVVGPDMIESFLR